MGDPEKIDPLRTYVIGEETLADAGSLDELLSELTKLTEQDDQPERTSEDDD